ncbi:hypothetical protein PoB_005447200 [Plakobranchus ocellatus]|uniref:Odorant receptor n=1 Tax=Plakobranchus ocellatus TaxID=259542 RepID=A0AAV4C9D7_9GAST|nr:hypothetical protein PoB_005447200 [Plakobranchus ocellatus]
MEGSMVTEASSLTEFLEADPPQPLYDGCAKKALSPVIQSMRLVGLFCENGKYPQILVNETTAVGKSPDSLNNLSKPDLHHAKEKNSKTVSRDLFITKVATNEPGLFANNSNGKRDNLAKDTKFVDYNKKAGLIVIESLHEGGLNQSAFSAPERDQSERYASKRNQSVNAASISVTNPGNFLVRCGMIQKSLKSSVIGELIYMYCHGNRDKHTHLAQKSAPLGMLQPEKTGLKWLISGRTYAFLVMMALWVNLFRMLQFIIHDFNTPFELILIPTLWYLMTVLTATALFISCTKNDHFSLFFHSWQALFQDPVTRGLGIRGPIYGKSNFYLLVLKWGMTVVNMASCFFIMTSEDAFSGGMNHDPVTRGLGIRGPIYGKSNFYLLVLKWGMTVVNMASCFFIMTSEDAFSGGMNHAFYITGHRSVASIAVSMIVLFFCTCAYVGLPVLIVAFCRLIISQFEEFAHIFRLHVTAAGNKFPKHLRMLRECHLAMCNIVEIMDRFMSFACGCLFG